MTIQDRINRASEKIKAGNKLIAEAEQELVAVRRAVRDSFKTEEEFRRFLKDTGRLKSDGLHERKAS